MTYIYYNNQQILSGQPTPLVARQDNMVSYGERWADQTVLTLHGQITGVVPNFTGLLAAQQQIIDIFSTDFQTFLITQDGQIGSGNYLELASGNGFVQLMDGTYILQASDVQGDGIIEIYSKPYCIIRNGVRFPQSRYVGILEYEVVIECYDQNLFSGFWGVLDPENTWVFEEQQDGKIQITHTVGARGFNTTSGASNALQNAKEFVSTYTGLSGMMMPVFISMPSGIVPCLRSEEKTVDKFNAHYTLKQTYEADYYYNHGGILRYTTDFDCDTKEGIAKVSVDGLIDGCKGCNVEDLRYRYSSFDIWGTAQNAFTNGGAPGLLNSGWLSSGVTEDSSKNTLSFNVKFDNYAGATTFFDYKIDISSGSNGITTVTLDGLIGARGDLATRWARVQYYYDNDLNMYGLATGAYYDYAGTGVGVPPLNPQTTTSGVSFNQYIAEIKTNATWNNKVIPVSGFATFDYTLQYAPALEKVVAKPLITDTNGPICGNPEGYYVLDLGYQTRCKFGINGNGTLDCGTDMTTAVAYIKQFANNLFYQNCPESSAILEKNVIATGTKTITFDFTWSAQSPNNVINSPSDYQTIYDLSLI